MSGVSRGKKHTGDDHVAHSVEKFVSSQFRLQPSTMRLEKPDNLTIQFLERDINTIKVVTGHYSSFVRIQGRVLGDSYVCACICDSASEWSLVHNHRRLIGDNTVVFNPGDDIDIRLDQGATIVTFCVEKSALNQRLLRLTGGRDYGDIDFHRVLGRAQADGMVFLQALSSVKLMIDAGDKRLSHPLGRANVEHFILDNFLFNVEHSATDLSMGEVSTVAPWYVKRAEDYIDAHISRPITLDRIAENVGTSVRTLTKGFRVYRNMSLMEYVRDRRLACIRADLLVARPDDTVTAIAFRWGFMHLGRFSAAYARRYGELPSETLQRVLNR